MTLTATAANRPAKPNIILMMADDMGLGDTSAYLGVRLMENAPPVAKTLRTPNLDAFSNQAMLFTDAHAPASMCSSTRYALLTGRFSHRAYLKNQGWLPHGPNRPMIQKAMATLPKMLQNNGYHTMIIGKYHVGIDFDNGTGNPAEDFYYHDVDFTKPLLDGPTHHGFDEYYGVPGNTEDPLDNEPRILIRNDRFVFTDRSKMKMIGMGKRKDKLIAAPDWTLKQLGALYLKEAHAFIERQAEEGTSPFFLYYAPNANHNQRNPNGAFAVPDSIAGMRIKGQSKYTDGSPAGPREDMVLENDVVFGDLLKKLKQTEDPRWPDHKLIENTLIIFTSDNGPNTKNRSTNETTNQESGGLRGKKAKIWEGGIRVPFIVYWKGYIQGPKINRNVLSHTDLYATLANIVRHQLQPHEAQDSHSALNYWIGSDEGPDLRPRVFFCNLGAPYLNDALAIRQGSKKLVVDGGLALPSIKNGSRGGLKHAIFYDLDQNTFEEGNFQKNPPSDEAVALGNKLIQLHNQGYARDMNLQPGSQLIQADGWHNLRNDINGAVGFEFRMNATSSVTHLGMWDDHEKDKGVRSARNVPTEHDRDQPSLGGGKKSTLAADHFVMLYELDGHGDAKGLVSVALKGSTPGELENEFRYMPIETTVTLNKDHSYLLLMSTTADDGDTFHDPASYDGLSPLVTPSVKIIRSIMVRGDVNQRDAIPAFSDLSDEYSQFRLPVGPTLKFKAN